MKINVTQKDIDLAVKQRDTNPEYDCSTMCLIGTVLKRRDIAFQKVGMTLVTLSYDFKILLPDIASDAVRCFVRNQEVKPFSFKLNLTKNWLEFF